MSDTLKDYIKNVIDVGDEGSKILAQATAETLENPGPAQVRILQDGMNGLAVLDIPKDHKVIVHSTGADPQIHNHKESGISLVQRLFDQRFPSSTPIGFANVIDSNTGDIEMLKGLSQGLVEAANNKSLKILNGENAILGDRVSADANLSGTMISVLPSTSIPAREGTITKDGIKYAFFEANDEPVLINSDGVGTKTEFYERLGKYEGAVSDFMAMNLDDAIKIAANARVISGVLEHTKGIPTEFLGQHLRNIASDMGIIGILQPEDLTGRIAGFNSETPTYNISGSVVSTINEARLKNPLKPQEGDYLIAIQGRKPNPRSNGISARRELMTKLGEEWMKGTEFTQWHETEKGQEFLSFLATPSTIFYPVFTGLINQGLATSVYHMSGGAYNGKLARPLAKERLFAKINSSDLFPLDERELELFSESGASLESAYENWPMGTEGFVTTSNPNETIKYLMSQGLNARNVAILEEGKTGVEIIFDKSKTVKFTGK